jgi:hypothetical protein
MGVKWRIVGNDATRSFAEEYKGLLVTIRSYELVVEQRQKEMDNAENEAQKNFAKESLELAKKYLREYKKQEKNHFYGGSSTPEAAWGDMSSNEEDEEECDEDMEILGDTKVDIEAFPETAGDDDMREVGQGYYGEKRKSYDYEIQEGESKVEEDEGEWKTVTNKKKTFKERKEKKKITVRK